MKELLEDILHTLNQLPDRKVTGKSWTTHELAERVDTKLKTLRINEVDKKYEDLYNEIYDSIPQ